jgi:hypothetical protein
MRWPLPYSMDMTKYYGTGIIRAYRTMPVPYSVNSNMDSFSKVPFRYVDKSDTFYTHGNEYNLKAELKSMCLLCSLRIICTVPCQYL